MAQWKSLAQKTKRNGNNFSGGINAGNNPMDLSDNQSTDENGMDTFSYPSLTVRKPRTSYGASGGATTRLLAPFATTHMVRAVGGKLQYNSSGTTWTDIASGLSDLEWDYTNFDISGSALILVNGVDSPRYWNGSALAVLSGSPPMGKYIASNNIRVYICKNDVIYYSGFLNALDWSSASSGFIQYYTPAGGYITGVASFEGHIVVFKRDSYALLYNTGDSRTTHRLVDNSSNIGCDSYKTIQQVGPYLFFKGPNDVYMLSGDSAKSIGQNIRKYLDAVNKTYADKCFGGSDGAGLRYYLGLVTGSNTEPDTMLVYDIRYNIWRVYDISINGMRYSCIFKNQWYAGNAAGQTFKMNDDGATTDDGAQIPWSWTSKPFNEGFPEAEKEYYEMHLQGYIPNGTAVNVAVASDDRSSSFTQIDSFTGADVSQNRNMIVPMDTVPLTNWMRYKLSGTGYAEINQVERYARIQPVQH